MRKPIIAGNWKMNKTPREAAELVRALIPLVDDADCEVVVCPPFTALQAVRELIEGTNIKWGAQNVHWAQNGAFTGEISVEMLLELGVAYAIVGHSERRQYFGDTDQSVNARAKAAFAGGITPIICVGETLEQRERGETDQIVFQQAVSALDGFTAGDVTHVVIAYEPIWAIGTGRTATSEQANDTIAVIRRAIASAYGEPAAQSVRIQYGGSMNANNAKELMAMPHIDGGLIGGASLKADAFAQIVHSAQ